MRILFIHNYYRQPGGEEFILGLEARLLKAAGHEVEIFSVSSSEIEAQALWRRLPRYASVLHAWGEARRLRTYLETKSFDIVHLHNLSPYLGPAVLAALPEDLRCVQTLHNYRAFCINGLFMRDGRPCEDCGHGNLLPGIVHRCHNQSLASSSLYSASRLMGILSNAWKRPQRFLCPSRFLAAKYASYGYPPEKLKLVLNTVEARGEANPNAELGLYLGRFSPEKGLDSLIAALKRQSSPFVLAGAGAEERRLKREAMQLEHVTWMPWQDSSGVEALLAKAAYLVMPSTCYENLPTAMLLAMSHGLPLIASKLGSMQELIEPGKMVSFLSLGIPRVWPWRCAACRPRVSRDAWKWGAVRGSFLNNPIRRRRIWLRSCGSIRATKMRPSC